MKYSAIILAFLLAGCHGQPEQNEKRAVADTTSFPAGDYVWTKLLDSAAWKKSYNFQMFCLRDTLWTLHNDGNWFSINGVDWQKSSLPNAIHDPGFLDYIEFKDAIFGLGRFEGNIERFTFKNDVYRTTDLRHWDTLPGSNNLPRRFFYHPFVFAGKIWIIGGEDGHTQYSDIWNSSDGVNWIKQKEDLPFGKRSRSQIVQLHKKLFLLDNDVWSSTDGLHWQMVTNEILKGENIFGYAALVFDDKIWLLGCNRNGRFSSQVLISSDGKTWTSEPAPWTPRGGIAATVYKGKIYMTGGKYGGTPDRTEFVYSNDVWTLAKMGE